MRKKIWRMSEGQFEETFPIIEFEPEVIDITIVAGDSYESSFKLASANGVHARGLVYSTHPYIYTITPAFSGLSADISYKIITDSLKPGDSLTGSFIVICNGERTSLDFSIKVVERYLESSLGPIQSLEDFCSLARRQWREAFRIFYTKDFADFINRLPVDIRLLYRGYQKAVPSSKNIEEFLTGAGLKPDMKFEINEKEQEFSFVNENIKRTIDITRSTWGYTEIKVSVDSDFVTVEKELITSDYFLGTKFNMNYYIHKDRLHSGRNYATITFEGMGVTRKIIIKASLGDFNKQSNTEYLDKKKLVFGLWKKYEDYRLRKITKAQWSGDTIDSINVLLDSDNIKNTKFIRLVMTHAMIVGDRKQDALWEMKRLRKDITDKRSTEWAYLLYLGALMEPEESYVKRLTQEIETIFRDHPEDVRIFWFLLFLRSEYRNDPSAKLKAVKQWIMSGVDSPVLFVEAYELFVQDSYLMSSFDDFTLKVLNWANKRGKLSTAVSDRLFDLIGQEKEFRGNVFRLLESGYSIASRSEYLYDILDYLLKFKVYNQDVVSWYELGISNNLKLTGLYEGYLFCLPLNHIDCIPNPVARYFSYGSNISYDRKALVMSNVITYKDRDRQLYEKFSHEIRNFCIEQLRLKHIDDNLAICYQDFLDNGYVDALAADLFGDLINIYKIVVPISGVKTILVYENAMSSPFVSPVTDHYGFARILTNDYRIFLEMEDGRVITDKTAYIVEPLLDPNSKLDSLKRLSENKLLYFIKDLSDIESSVELNASNIETAKEFLFSPLISSDYINERLPMLVNYFRDYEREDIILESLLNNNRFEVLDTQTINYLVELLILNNRYEIAEEIMRKYICLDVDPNLLLRLMNKLVLRPREENGEFILEICIWLLRQMYYSPETLSYLNDHYIGSTEDMMLIFNYADHHTMEIGDLAERIIVQMLYTEILDEKADSVFMTYCEHKSNAMIIEAYLTYWSHKYMLTDTIPPASVFAILFQQERVAYGMNDTCRLALMKHLATKDELSPKEYNMLDAMLREHIQKNIYFSYYRNMRPELIVKYHLYDKMFAQYKGSPKRNIMIRYKKDNGDFINADMIEMYNGIYVKQFIVFFGETIRYEIYDKDDDKNILYSDDLIFQDIIEKGKGSRYGLINRIESSYLYHNDEEMLLNMERFKRLDTIGSDLFNII